MRDSCLRSSSRSMLTRRSSSRASASCAHRLFAAQPKRFQPLPLIIEHRLGDIGALERFAERLLEACEGAIAVVARRAGRVAWLRHCGAVARWRRSNRDVCDEVANGRIVLVASVLEHAIVVVTLQRKRRLPRFGQNDRILDRDLVVDRVRCRPCEPLDDAQVAARRDRLAAGSDDQHRRFAVEVAGLDDERVTLEMPARVAEPLDDLARERRPAVEGHDARLVDELETNCDVARRLHDLDAAVVHEREHRCGQATRDAAVERVEVRDLVERNVGPAARHRRGATFAFGRQRRKAAVRRFHDQ